MKSVETIKYLLEKMGYQKVDVLWEPVTYAPQGREGGYDISFDEESQSDSVANRIEQLIKGEKVQIKDKHGYAAYMFLNGCIQGYNAKAIVRLIKHLPTLTPNPLP